MPFADVPCRGQAQLFFAPAGERPEARRSREAVARAYCPACPAELACREWARAKMRARAGGDDGHDEDEA